MKLLKIISRRKGLHILPFYKNLDYSLINNGFYSAFDDPKIEYFKYQTKFKNITIDKFEQEMSPFELKKEVLCFTNEFSDLKKNQREYDDLILNDTLLKYYDIDFELKKLYIQFTEFLTNPNFTQIDIFERDYGYQLLHTLNNQKKQGTVFEVEKLSLNDLSFEKIEILNIFGLHGDRRKIFPHNKIELLNNSYEKGLLQYQFENDYIAPTFNNSLSYDIIVRIAMKVKHKPTFTVKTNDEVIQQEKDECSHLVIFEHTFKTIDDILQVQLNHQNFEELLKLSVYGEWKIVDVDGYFEGNSFFRKQWPLNLHKTTFQNPKPITENEKYLDDLRETFEEIEEILEEAREVNFDIKKAFADRIKNPSKQFNQMLQSFYFFQIMIISKMKKYLIVKTPAYLELIRFNKQTGTLLCYLPFVWGTLTVSPSLISPSTIGYLSLFGYHCFMARSIGCIANDFWDKDFDKQVQRTSLRPIARGDITRKEAFIFSLICFASTTPFFYFYNFNSFIAGIGFGLFGVIYPLAKRYTFYPQYVLGLCFNSGIFISSILITNHIPIHLIPFYLGSILWTVIYDTVYAFQDFQDDKLVGVKSYTFLIAESPKEQLTKLINIMSVCFLISGVLNNFNPVMILGPLLGNHFLKLKLKMVDFEDKKQCDKFFQMNIYFGIYLVMIVIFSKMFERNKKKDFSKNDENNQQNYFIKQSLIQSSYLIKQLFNLFYRMLTNITIML